MSNSFSRKIKSFLVRLFVICLFSLISFFLIYKISFLPSGYDIASEQKNSVIIKSFNTFGIGENITTVTFPSNDKGKNDDSGYELKRQVERQKVYLWLIFALLPTSVYLIVSKLRNGEKVWKALLGSNILGILPPLILLMYSLDRIQYLIS